MRNVAQLCLAVNIIIILFMRKWNPLLQSLLCENGAQNGRYSLKNKHGDRIIKQLSN